MPCTRDDNAAAGVQVYLACGTTDMRKGMAMLAMLVQQTLVMIHFRARFTRFAGAEAG